MWSLARAICKFAFFLFAFVLEVISHQEAFLRRKRFFFSSLCNARIKIIMIKRAKNKNIFCLILRDFVVNACESSWKQTMRNIKINTAIDFS